MSFHRRDTTQAIIAALCAEAIVALACFVGIGAAVLGMWK